MIATEKDNLFAATVDRHFFQKISTRTFLFCFTPPAALCIAISINLDEIFFGYECTMRRKPKCSCIVVCELYLRRIQSLVRPPTFISIRGWTSSSININASRDCFIKRRPLRWQRIYATIIVVYQFTGSFPMQKWRLQI